MGRYRRSLRYRTWWRLLRWTISTSWAHRGAWGRGLPAVGVAAAAGIVRGWVLPASPVEAVVAGAVLAVVPVIVWRLSPPRRGERLGKMVALAALLAWVFTGWWPLALAAVVLVVAAHVRDPREHVVRADGELRPLPRWARPRSLTHRARQRGRAVTARTLRTWIIWLDQGVTRVHAPADRPITRLPAATPRATTRPITRAADGLADEHAPPCAPAKDAAALDDHAPHTVYVPVAPPSRPPVDPVAHVRWLLERAGDDGCTPVELYTAVGRSRSWWSPIARDADWMVRGGDGHYRLTGDHDLH